MNLLRFRPTSKTIRLDDGRRVKATIDDTRTVQQVEDGDRMHGTGRLSAVELTMHSPSKQRRPLLLRGLGMPKMRQAWNRTENEGLWAPVPEPPKDLILP